MEEKEEMAKVFVVGHRNPDTDSICSAISYANLKNTSDDGKQYVACRAGRVNEETKYVLNYFGIQEPELVEDVRTQVRDIDFRRTPGVQRNISLKTAWRIMKDERVVTVPVVNRKRLEGVLTVSDITDSFMEAYDSEILSTAHTRYCNIVDTLEGTLLIGDEKAYYTKGKVLVAAANPDLMESYISKHDLVILGNRYESQLCAIEMEADCIVVCEGAPVSLTIRKLAQERGCTVISTPFDTFTAARFINQSMPISYFMRRDHLITFEEDEFIDDIRDTMASVRHRDFPIINSQGQYLGTISRRNLLGAKKKQVILVDHNESGQAVRGIQDAQILEIIDHHRLGTIETMTPVYFRNQPLGCTATIIYQMYQEHGVELTREIAGLLCGAIISDTLLFRSPTCTAIDRMVAEKLGMIAKIDLESFAKEMFAAGSNLKNKTEEQIFFQDYKRFTMESLEVGVAQISSMNPDELSELCTRMPAYLEKAAEQQKVDMIFMMLTSIIDESTILLCYGKNCEKIVQYAFTKQLTDGKVELPGVVSRKKQLVPALMTGIQMMMQ